MACNLEEVGSSRQEGSLVVAVEGNIGSGKSTFLTYCKANGNIEVFPEPVERWTNVNGVNLMERFYANPIKWGMTFQMQVNVSMLQQYLERSVMPIKILERSLWSARHCFQRDMTSCGILEPAMSSVLDQWHDVVEQNWKSRPHVIVYVRTSPVVAYARMSSRARCEESTVTLEYLERLNQYHEDWLAELQQRNMIELADVPIFVIDADLPLNELKAGYERCIGDLNLLLL